MARAAETQQGQPQQPPDPQAEPDWQVAEPGAEPEEPLFDPDGEPTPVPEEVPPDADAEYRGEVEGGVARMRGNQRRRAAQELIEVPTGRPGDGEEILPPVLAQAWDEAERRGAETGDTYVPVLAIRVDMHILPRSGLDQDAVDRYAAALDQLPPIKVQRDTLTLIGGRHRLAAAGQEMRNVIKVEEVDVADRDLFMAATVDNVAHGLPLTPRERAEAARRLLQEHPELGKTRVAEMVGMSRITLWRWEREGDPSEAAPAAGPARRPFLPRDFLANFERTTTGLGDAGALVAAVEPDQAWARLARVGAVIAWLGAYQEALRQRVESTDTAETVPV